MFNMLLNVKQIIVMIITKDDSENQKCRFFRNQLDSIMFMR